MGKKNVTLKDISIKSGYSIYTVSRAFNDEKDISQETKNKILKIANELGYIQNVTARNLRLGRTKTIGIIYDDFLNPYYSILIEKLFSFLKEKGYDATLFYDFNSISKLNDEFMNRIISNNVEGVISLIEVTPKAYEIAKKINLPIVQFGSRTSIETLNCVSFDDVEGGKIACNYLLTQGKKKISFIAPTIEQSASINRIDGYKESLIENKIGVDNNLIIYLKENNLDASEALSKLLNLHVDGIITFNDFTGYLIQKELEEMNLKNIQVVGFDNLASVYPFTNKIRSIGGNITEATYIVVNNILSQIEGNNISIHITLPMRIN